MDYVDYRNRYLRLKDKWWWRAESWVRHKFFGHTHCYSFTGEIGGTYWAFCWRCMKWEWTHQFLIPRLPDYMDKEREYILLNAEEEDKRTGWAKLVKITGMSLDEQQLFVTYLTKVKNMSEGYPKAVTFQALMAHYFELWPDGYRGLDKDTPKVKIVTDNLAEAVAKAKAYDPTIKVEKYVEGKWIPCTFAEEQLIIGSEENK